MEHFATTRYILAVVCLVLALGGAGARAQTQSSSGSFDPLTPRLRVVAENPGSSSSFRPLLDPISSGSSSSEARYGVFVHVENERALKQTDLPTHSVATGLATARLTARQLRDVAKLEGVRRVSPTRTHEPLTDGIRDQTGAHPLHVGRLGQQYTGESTLACIIDTGIDWRHPDFRGSMDTTRTRVRALWDQTLSPQPAERSPSGFRYGVEYTRSALENELGESSAEQVRSVDKKGHGTAVASIFAGNGTGMTTRTHIGMAPKADIVVVKTDFSSVGIADGLQYCRQTADDADRPVVVSVGAGTLAGPHDGSSPLAQTIDAFTGAGRSVVVAAGNSGDTKRHVAKSLSGKTTDSLQIRVPRFSTTEGANNDTAFHLDVWTKSISSPVSLVTPTGRRVSLRSDSAAIIRTADGAVAYERSTGPQGDGHVELMVYDASEDVPPTSGTWNVVLTNTSSRSTTVHGWLVQTNTGSTLPDGDRRSTITTPATAQSALAVGARTHRLRWQSSDGTDISRPRTDAGTVAPFSSHGPLPNGRRKPDLVAPGHWVMAARSQSSEIPSRRTISNGPYGMFRGTSMAAAATAGAVSLLLQADPSLSTDRITTLLTKTGHSESDRDRRWTRSGGHGSLDIFGAMAELLNVPVATRTVLGYDDAVSEDDQTTHTIGGGENSAVSVRLTPNRSGAVDGLYLRTAPGSSNELKDSLRVAIYTDNQGRPGRQIGTSVGIAPEAIQSHTNNFVSIAGTNAVVRKGVDYHIIVQTKRNGGTLTLTGERRSVDDRSLVRRSGTWRGLSSDLSVRLTTSFSLDLETPSATAPERRAIVEEPDVPTLSWDGVSEANRYTVHVSPSSRFRAAETDTFRTRTSSLSLPELSPSTSYYWRVRAERLEYVSSWSNVRSFLYYPGTVATEAERTFDVRGDTSTYGLVALPGQRSTSVTRTVSGRAGSDWQAYWDPGHTDAGLVSSDGSSTFQFQPGTGFWLRSTQPWVVEDSVASVPLDDDGTYSIPLHDGWNIISNPFDLAVSWRAVEQVNEDALPPLWRFAGDFERTETFGSAQDGEAFYFLNDQNRDVLRIPYPAYPGAPNGRGSSKRKSHALILSMSQENGGSSQVYVGTRKNAAKGQDRYDHIAPPKRFASLSLRINPSTGDKTPQNRDLIADYRSPDSDGHTFPVTLRTDQTDPVTVRIDSVGTFPDQRIVLLDPASGDSYDLRTASPLTIRPDGETQSFRLLIGSSEYVEEKKSVELPSELQFLPNYPNPFSEQTTLEYVLPAAASVRVTVYDVLGRQVRVLVNKRQEPGRHTVQWAGKDESGQRMASGVYLARLVVDGTTKVRKITFVR